MILSQLERLFTMLDQINVENIRKNPLIPSIFDRSNKTHRNSEATSFSMAAATDLS